jgi:asparaginyl-tRNA synthetase
MVEPEIVFVDLDTLIKLVENLIKYVIDYIINNNIKELEFLEKYNKREIISKLKKILGVNFKKVEYSESVKILEKNKKSFVFNDIK